MATNMKRGPANKSIQVAMVGSIWGFGDKTVGTVIDNREEGNLKKNIYLTFIQLGKSVKNKFLFTMTAFPGQTSKTLGLLCSALWDSQ